MVSGTRKEKWLRRRTVESVSVFVLRFSVVQNNRTGPALLELHPERSRLSLNSPHQALVGLILCERVTAETQKLTNVAPVAIMLLESSSICFFQVIQHTSSTVRAHKFNFANTTNNF